MEVTLLRENGDEYDGLVIIKKFSPPYNKRRVETVEYADNSIGLIEMGEVLGRIDSFIIEVGSPFTAAQIQSDIGKEENEGQFLIRAPYLAVNGEEGGMLYRVIITELNFQAQTIRRGPFQVFSATASNVQVLDEEAY